jgi:histidine ammonia-lyase
MLAVGTLPFSDGLNLLGIADKIAALSYEGLVGNPQALEKRIHQLRGQPGQAASADHILKQLEGSYLFDKKTKRGRIQDPYSLRCAPQVHGPARDAFRFVESILQNEWNAGTDNPLVFPESGTIISGGNFHGQYLALGFDVAAISLAEIGSISERRLELLLNPHLSGLPPFLAENQGINSGYMAAQYLSASLVNENKHLANPSCTDSIPGNAGIEDHVSMGMTSARKFKKLVENVRVILAVEMVAAVQAIDLRGVSKLGKGTEEIYRKVRKEIPKLTTDRMISTDVKKGVEILKKLQLLNRE